MSSFTLTANALPPRRATRSSAAARARTRVKRRRLTFALVAVLALLATIGSGFGATSASNTVIVTTNIADTISLIQPASLDASPAPTAGATWTAGSPSSINLGQLQGSVVRSASATWKVSTNSVNGYSLTLTNPASAPVMKSGTNTYPDMCTVGGGCPAALSTATSAFGVAVGDSTGHSQLAVPALWGTTGGGGTQGTQFAGIPVGGMTIGLRGAAISNDPVTLNFAAVSNSLNLRPPGIYAGSILLTAISL